MPGCEEFHDRLFEFLDGEASQDDCTWMEQHLATCPECLEERDCSAHLKALVRRSCGCTSAPDELRSRVVMTISTLTMTWRTQ